MKTKKALTPVKPLKPIQPLFSVANHKKHVDKLIVQFARDDYNKGIGTALIEATNDAEAIASFLQEYQESPGTLRSYTKEIERLLLWCIHVAKISISSLRRDHLLQYQEFLTAPTPKKLWCGPSVSRHTKDGALNDQWRPFVKGLSGNTLHKVLTILDSFFNYLVQAHYLIGNPLAIDRRRKKRNKAKARIIDRYLELDEIQAVLNAVKEHPYSNAKEKFQRLRARYIILLLFYTGLRIAEAANHRMGNCIQREDNWFLRVTGKGKKVREIPLPDELLVALQDFRKHSGLSSPLPTFREHTPLIPMQNLKQSISTRRIDQILRWAFQLGAARLGAREPRKASKLRQASAHWLRHSYVTYLLDSGAPLKVAQENAGHSDVGTTMHYRHMAQTDRHAATKLLSLTKKKSPRRSEA